MSPLSEPGHAASGRVPPLRILVVEDEPQISRQLDTALTAAGYEVTCALDGAQGFALGESGGFDAAILDLGLPTMAGMEVLRRWRANGVAMPVLILTAQDHWADRVAGIDAGADDYVAKPFYMPEVISRVRAVIRRSRVKHAQILRHGPISYDRNAGEARRDGKPISLTTFEQRLLLYFLENPRRTIGRAEIIEHLYAQDFDRDSNTVEVFIRRLRTKLGADAIETIRGRGYRLFDVPRGTEGGEGAGEAGSPSAKKMANA